MKNIIILIFMIVMTQIISLADASETRLQVVVIDTGVATYQKNKPYMCKNGVLSAINDDGIDMHGHGTNVIGLIAKKINHKKYCITSIKAIGVNPKGNILHYINALAISTKINPSVVNISMSGDDSSTMEKIYISRLLSNGTKVVVAAGNDKANLDERCFAYPACLKKELPSYFSKNLFVVSNKDVLSANQGSVVTHYRKGLKQGLPIMSGTSQSTANLTAEMVK